MLLTLAKILGIFETWQFILIVALVVLVVVLTILKKRQQV